MDSPIDGDDQQNTDVYLRQGFLLLGHDWFKLWQLLQQTWQRRTFPGIWEMGRKFKWSLCNWLFYLIWLYLILFLGTVHKRRPQFRGGGKKCVTVTPFKGSHIVQKTKMWQRGSENYEKLRMSLMDGPLRLSTLSSQSKTTS